jgi:hypothetical protein
MLLPCSTCSLNSGTLMVREILFSPKNLPDFMPMPILITSTRDTVDGTQVTTMKPSSGDTSGSPSQRGQEAKKGKKKERQTRVSVSFLFFVFYFWLSRQLTVGDGMVNSQPGHIRGREVDARQVLLFPVAVVAQGK